MNMDQGALLFSLIGTKETLEADIATRKKALEEVNIAIAEIATPLANAVYKRENKTSGTVRFAVGNRIYKAVVDKATDYDNDKLMAVAASVPWDQAREIFKFKASVPEKAFKAITDIELRAKIAEARTVKYSAPKITAED